MPLLPPVEVTLFTPAGFWMLVQQLLIGVGIGLTMQLAFSAVRLAGEMIGLQMGLSFATLLDPNSRINMPLLARFLDMLAMLLFLMISSKGIAGVPRASLVVIAAVLPVFDIPEAGLLLILAIDHFLDMGRTATNVIGNAVAASVVAKWEGGFDPREPAEIDPAVAEGPALPPATSFRH